MLHNMMEENLPIALRRTPRCQQRRGESPEMISSSKRTARGSQRRPTTALKTPRGRSKGVHIRDQAPDSKRATQQQRNVDDGTITVLDFDIPVRTMPSPPGLKSKRQRHSTGIHGTPSKRPRQDRGGIDACGAEESERVHIFPLRQILDGRIRRRIRRNGLSEEMNAIHSEKRTRRKRTEQELRRLRDEMAGKDAEIERLRGFDSSTAVFGSETCDTSRIQEIEKRLTKLKEEFSHASSASLDPAHFDDSGIGMSSDGLWDHDSDDGGMMDVTVDDEEFRNSTAADLQCNTTPEQPSRTWASDTSSPRMSGPTLISPPSTSPTKPSSPATERRQRHHIFSNSSTAPANIRTCDAALQACIADPGTETMEQELNALRSEVASLNQTLQAQEAQIMEKFSENQHGCNDQDLELQFDIVMQDLSDKMASLAELQSSLSSLLSSPFTDEEEDATDQLTMLKGLTEALHSVRLELEYLSPGEGLPDGADEVLDLAVQRLRDLDRELREKDESLQEKDAMIQHQDEIIKDGDRQIEERDLTIREKDSRISSLELDVERLNGTMADLEALARLLDDNESALRGQLTAEREAASRRDEALADTEVKLADVLAQTAALRAQLADKDMQIIQRDAKMAGLRGEVERLDGALAEAHGHLRAARGEAVRDRVAAQNAVAAMRAQLLQVLSVGEGFLGGVACEPASASSSFSAVIPNEEESGRGAKGCDGPGVEGGDDGDGGEAKGIADLATLPAVPTGFFARNEAGKLDCGVGLFQ